MLHSNEIASSLDENIFDSLNVILYKWRMEWSVNNIQELSNINFSSKDNHLVLMSTPGNGTIVLSPNYKSATNQSNVCHNTTAQGRFCLVDFSPSFMLKFSKYPNSNFGWSYGHLNKNLPFLRHPVYLIFALRRAEQRFLHRLPLH